VNWAWADIVAVVEMRRAETSPIITQMMAVREAYNADVVFPIFDKPDEPAVSPLTPLLVAETVDNLALRAAGVTPSMDSPALEPAKLSGVRSREYADIRRKVLYGTHFHSRTKIGLRRVYRHLAGYASAAMTVTPDLRSQMPRIEVRDPLATFPEPKAPEDLTPPRNVAFVMGRSATWLRDTYPQSKRENGGPVGPPGRDPEMWDTVEWLDEDVCVIGILGPRSGWCQSALPVRERGMPLHMELVRYQHHGGGRCPAVVLPRVTLDRIVSAVAHTLGTIEVGSKMMHLWMMAQEKAIFPDKWAIATPGQVPAIITNGGRWADGRTGQLNLLEGVGAVGELRSTPDQMTGQFIDRLERNMRISTGLVPQAGGETYGALRTGRGIDALYGIAVDPRVQELQEIVEYGLIELNKVVLDCWKGWWDTKKVTLFTGKMGDGSSVEFTPSTHIETTDNVVSYPAPGSDLQGTTIRLSQLYGVKAISLDTLRSKHPDVDDPGYESNQVDIEELELAMLESIKTKASAGQLPLVYLADIAEARRGGLSILESIRVADDKARAAQAQEAQLTPPGEPNAPELMPGLEGAPQAQPALPPGPPIAAAPGQDSLAGLMQTLEQIG